MFEDSYLDSFMEGYIGNWSGDEDRYYEEQAGIPCPEDAYCPDLDDEIDDLDSDPEFDYFGLDDQHDY